MIVNAVALSIIGLAFLVLFGAVIYAIVLAAGDGFVALLQAARDRASLRITRAQRLGLNKVGRDVVNGPGMSRTEPPELSTEAIWHHMQGTSKKSHRRGLGS